MGWSWPEPARRYAAMVSLVDRQVGEVLALLKELGIEDNTLVFFSGDNGGADYFTSADHPRGIHSANKHPETGVEFRGKKGNLYEGGLRVPFLARWPGKIAPGRTTDHLSYFPDLLPTIAEVTGAKAPSDIDGISILPTLIGEAAAAITTVAATPACAAAQATACAWFPAETVITPRAFCSGAS